LNNSIIEINKKKAKAGRTPVTLILHEIPKDQSEYNRNGITWVREYCEQNIDSIKGMQLVTQFLDNKHEVPFGDHGNMIVEENKVIFEDSLVVGSFEEGYIAENIEVDGKTIDAVVGRGYIYNQRFPALVDYLQEEYDNGNSIEGSVEICAATSIGNDKIIYDGGWKEKGRKPQIFEYSGHALVIGTTPADDSALLLELNSYKKKEGDSKKMKKDIINKGVTIEINKLSFDDMACLITRAFNKAMGVTDYYNDYYIHRFYPESNEVVFTKWQDVGNYFMTSYKVENNSVTIGDIIQVSEEWVPVSNSQSVEVNINKIKEIITNKGGNEGMNVEELNAKIVELTAQLTELNTKVTELNSANVEKDNKITELNSLLVEANKTIEEVNGKCSALEVECNGYKEEKEKMEKEKRQAEINTYFETEIPKNNFEETEVNSLKEYVEKCDLEGLKKAEADLIVKKFKEGKIAEIEINSKKEGNIFFHTKEEKLDDIEVGKSLFK
jgi:hypothetical protein